MSNFLEQWSHEGAALVLTVGGSGLGPRDRTPEATRRVIEREAPGLAEAMRAKGAERNPFAWLSRGVAGLKGNTLIINLPGSREGQKRASPRFSRLCGTGSKWLPGAKHIPESNYF